MGVLSLRTGLGVLGLFALGLLGCDSGEGVEPPLDCPANFLEQDGLCVEQALDPLVVFDGDLHLAGPGDAADFCAEFNAVQGDVTMEPNLSSVEGLSCLRQIAGDLRIEEIGSIQDFDLPSLTWVGGELAIQVTAPGVNSVELAALEGVGEGLTVHFTELQALRLPSLRRVEGHVSLYANNFLSELDLSGLEQVGDDELTTDSVLYIRLNKALRRIELPALRQVAGVLKISSNRVMTELSMPALERAGWGFYISYCESLESYSIPIREVGGFVYLANSYVSSITLPELATIDGDLNVIFNNDLSELTMPGLDFVGGNVVFQANHSLPEAAIDEVLDGVEILGTIRREGNGG